MKRLRVIMFFFPLIIVMGCAEKRVLYSEVKVDGGIYYFHDEPFTGILFEMWDENQLRLEIPFKNGKAVGESKAFYENGQLEKWGIFKNGKPNGIWNWYYENGQLNREGAYKDGEPDGVWKWYFEDGKLEKEETYRDGEVIN